MRNNTNKRRVIRMTEGRFIDLVAETATRMLKEYSLVNRDERAEVREASGLYNQIDNDLADLGNVQVARFYSYGTDHVTIQIGGDVDIHSVIDYMGSIGYDYNGSGSNGGYRMLEFDAE